MTTSTSGPHRRARRGRTTTSPRADCRDDSASGSASLTVPASRMPARRSWPGSSTSIEFDWEYEPRTFPVLWNLDGQVVESFSPDFYLPELDLWVELTTLRQSLVRKKNRKLRRMRELYPMVRLKLLYARDFRALMLKYGRLELATSLIGTDGQVVPGG